MTDLAAPTDIVVPAAQAHRILQVYNDGLYLQAYRLAEVVGPLKRWRGAEARILAGRMAGNLGSMRLANWHFIHAYRRQPTHPEAMWFFARYLLGVRGPLAAWTFVKNRVFPANAAKELQSHWCSQHAAILSRLRDFDAAEEWLRKAESLGPEAWTCLEWASLFSLEDRHDEAEAAARRALELHPWYRPAVQWVAHFLVQKERDDEALDLLTQATQRLESGALFAQLAALQFEVTRYDEAARSLDEVERHSPLADRLLTQWLAARRCDLACYRGDFDRAIQLAQDAAGSITNQLGMESGCRERFQSKFYANLIPVLKNRSGAGKRVALPVRFVRQHHRTCAPATLVAIAKFWNMPAEHLEIAADISYAGTPNHSQRQWANEHGWHTKEFTVTWDSAVALIERGIPFTLATTEVASAHLQAVIGYDSLRRTLLIRDPGDRHQVEMAFDVMLERYRSSGPRGMALVPIAQKAALESLPLPDEALYDHFFRMELALKDHRRDEAGQAAQALADQSPQHFLAVTARLTLAYYDTDQPQALMHLERLLELFPGDLHHELNRANLLSVLGRYPQRLELLKRLAEKKESDPACWQQYAWELSADARQQPQALYLLRKAARCNPMLGRTYGTLARIRSAQRKFDEALELYHFAVCLDDKDEFTAQDYFGEARAQGKLDEALEFLRRRFDRFGAQSSQTARTLYSALVQQGRFDDAINVLERAMKLRPEDGELLTYSAEAHLNLGDFAAAEAILEKARGVSKPAARWRALALAATYQNDSTRVRECCEEILKIEPIAEDAHRNYCLLLADKEGREAAVAHLRAVCKRFPHHFNLNRMLCDWLLEDGPAARERILKSLIDIHPAHAATRVEYAYNLSDQDRLEEAHQQLDEADALDPDAPAAWFARGVFHKKKDKVEDAQYAFREAIRRSADFEPAIEELVWSCENLADRREAVAFIVGELLRQKTFGGGAVALSNTAQAAMPPREFLAIESRVRAALPHVWELWWLVERQSGYCELTDERLTRAQEAVRQFPAVSDLWIALGEVQRVQGNADAELQALQRAVELAPYSLPATRALAEALERAGKVDQAKKVLQQAIRRAPLVSDYYLEYAALLFRSGAHEEAIRQARHALKLDPWFEDAWNHLAQWSVQLARVPELIELARGWTKSCPGNWRSWFRLALAVQMHPAHANEDQEGKRIDECTAAYQEAIKRNPLGYAWANPRNPNPRDLHDSFAEMLGLAGRYDAAAEACNPPAFRGKPPFNLRGRAAWVLAMQGDHDGAKKQMARVLKENRAYPWGWDRLVEWSAATNDYKAYYDAANDFVRARPQSALAQAYRGEALLRMDERESGKEDVRAAVRRDPCQAFHTFLLFDEQLSDDDLDGAETTLASMQQNIAACIYGARPIQYHAKRENKQQALDCFKELCSGPFLPPQALEMAMRALDYANWKAEAEEIICAALERAEWHPDYAIVYASYWNPGKANDLPDRIAALDKALAKYPGALRYLDLKAELLTNGNQFERAWQTCKEKTFPVDQPYLDARAAWVKSRAGSQDEAIEEMRDLLRANPKLVVGWMQLADWYGQRQKWVDVLTVAEQLVQIAPRDPIGFGYRGQAKENLGDPQAARADYVHALDLQPGYLFAAWQLFYLHVRNGEWQRAEKLLEKTKRYADPGEWAMRKIELLLYQNKKSGFAAEFENLCKKSAKSPWLIDQALNFIVQAGWWSDAEEVLHRNLDLGPHICDPWVRIRVAMGDRRVGSDVQKMAKSRPERTNCIAAYAVELAWSKDAAGLRRWINVHDDCLRGDTPSWAKVGAALAIVEEWGVLIDWMSDWAEHAEALPGMLMPLVKALRSLGEVEEARQVSRHALTKLNPDYASSFHNVWLMFDQALDGDLAPVQRYLDSSDLGAFDGYQQMISALVRAIAMTATDKAHGFANARRLLADVARHAPPTVTDPALRNAYQDCVAEMARLRGTIGATLWRWWRRLFPRLPAPPKVG